MGRRFGKLRLSKETIRSLDETSLQRAVGASEGCPQIVPALKEPAPTWICRTYIMGMGGCTDQNCVTFAYPNCHKAFVSVWGVTCHP